MVLHKKSGSKCKSRSANIVTTGTQGSHPSLNIKLKESKCNFMTTDGRMLSLICRSSTPAFSIDLRPKLPTHGISLWRPADETKRSTTAINMALCETWIMVYCCQNNENLYVLRVCCCVTLMKENCQGHTDSQQNEAFTIMFSKKKNENKTKKTNKKCCP